MPDGLNVQNDSGVAGPGLIEPRAPWRGLGLQGPDTDTGTDAVTGAQFQTGVPGSVEGAADARGHLDGMGLPLQGNSQYHNSWDRLVDIWSSDGLLSDKLRQTRQWGTGVFPSSQQLEGTAQVSQGLATPEIPAIGLLAGSADSLLSSSVPARSDLDRVTGPDVHVPSQAQSASDGLYASKGYGYRKSQVVHQSHYYDPIVHSHDQSGGLSRRVGDALPATQQQAIDAIISAGHSAGMTDNQIALTLAIAREESGFNPDAAAGTTSASGLGQFVDATGKKYGLDGGNRWNLDAQARALVQLTLENINLAKSKGYTGADVDRYTYAYHHDGPGLKHGGLDIAARHVVPTIGTYLPYVQSTTSTNAH